jgi:hypothetical protein
LLYRAISMGRAICGDRETVIDDHEGLWFLKTCRDVL